MTDVSKAPVERVQIDKIQIGVRRRKKVTGIGGLKRSIEEHGLIHPILIRGGNELVAGARRLAACAELGWKSIPARLVDKLSDEELRALELEENSERSDLNDFETSKQRLAEMRQAEAAAKAEPEAEGDSGPARAVKRPHRKTGGKGGRKRSAGSERDVQARTGIPRAEQQRTEKHVEIAESFPFMQAPGWVQGTVLRAGKLLDKLPEEEHAGVAVLLDRPGIIPAKAIKQLSNLVEMEPEKRAEIYEMARDPDPHVRSRAGTTALAIEHEPDPGLLVLLGAEKDIRRAAKECRLVEFKPRIVEMADAVEVLAGELRKADQAKRKEK